MSYRLILSSTLLAGMVLALLMSVSSALHDELHGDADGTHHECLATILHTGKGAGPGAPPTLLLADLGQELFVVLTPPSRDAESLFLSARIFEHAPPLNS